MPRPAKCLELLVRIGVGSPLSALPCLSLVVALPTAPSPQLSRRSALHSAAATALLTLAPQWGAQAADKGELHAVWTKPMWPSDVMPPPVHSTGRV